MLAADRAYAKAGAGSDLVDGVPAMFDAETVMPTPGGFATGKDAIVAALKANPANAGARAPELDAIDARIVRSVREGTTTGPIKEINHYTVELSHAPVGEIYVTVSAALSPDEEARDTFANPTGYGLSDGAAWPIKNAIVKFRSEFEEYITSGRRTDRYSPPASSAVRYIGSATGFASVAVSTDAR